MAQRTLRQALARKAKLSQSRCPIFDRGEDVCAKEASTMVYGPKSAEIGVGVVGVLAGLVTSLVTGLAEIVEGLVSFFSKLLLSTAFRIIFGVAIVATLIGLAVNAFFGGDVGDPKLWYAATAAIVFFDVCIFAFGEYRDRAQEAKKKRYIETLEALYRAGVARSAKSK